MSVLGRWGSVAAAAGARRLAIAILSVGMVAGIGTAIAVAQDDPPPAADEAAPAAEEAAPAAEETPVVYDEAQVERGLQVYKDGGCRACHGWSGNGIREGENIDGPSIRGTLLTPELIRLTVACGRPGGPMMPRYDQQAYNLDGRCYGIDRFNVGDMILPPRGRTGFTAAQLDDLVVYLMARVVGLPDEPTREECMLFFNDEAACAAIFDR